ncbi:mucin-binding protein, partial [Lacticaseibacillus thailandensis]
MYDADAQTVTVKFEDVSDNSPLQPDATITGTSAATIDYDKDANGDAINYVIAGYTL